MFEDGGIINELFIERLNYLIYVVLLLIGLHAMIAKNNLIKKLIGMSIFQTAIILFYVSVGVKEGATIPIYLPEHDPHGSHATDEDGNQSTEQSHGPVVLEAGLVKGYSNPLPHVLMLTAIVVGVATLGLALALCQRIYQGYGTIEEDELLVQIEKQETRTVPGIASKESQSKAVAVKMASVTKPKVSNAKPKSSAKPTPKKPTPKSKAKSVSSTSKASSSRSASVKSKAKRASTKSTTTSKVKPASKAKSTHSSQSASVKSKAKRAGTKSTTTGKAKPVTKAKSTTSAKSAPAKAKTGTVKSKAPSKGKPATKPKSTTKPKSSTTPKKSTSAKARPRTPKK
jgi:multicomponent Na+:H+ antiporter subunit C